VGAGAGAAAVPTVDALFDELDALAVDDNHDHHDYQHETDIAALTSSPSPDAM
jgi:hypothetical protein